MGTEKSDRMLKRILAKLNEQRKVATLDYMRFGKGRDRLVRLQYLQRRYAGAVERDGLTAQKHKTAERTIAA